MKIKLDENVHGDVADALTARGHDVTTARGEGLGGRADSEVASAVRSEGRCLVTFDLDFADPRAFPPEKLYGLVALRLRHPTGRRQVDRIVEFFDEKPDLGGQLWILEEDRARNWTP
ncbi:MAG: DUF5615 family PIN-like protein [Acidobacteria bacterium]|nr:DUF5615 family PIN-like protein [Acidobacteriota bacterium]